jgi:hypothetical protein
LIPQALRSYQFDLQDGIVRGQRRVYTLPDFSFTMIDGRCPDRSCMKCEQRFHTPGIDNTLLRVKLIVTP